MRWHGALFFGILVIGNIFAQAVKSTSSPGEPQVVRVQMGYVCGWCGGDGYRTDLTTVERPFIAREMGDAENPKKFPKRKQRRAITKREWETLVHSIDAKALRAVPQDGECRPCIDQPDSWVEIGYSDGSKIDVHYWPGSQPAPVKALKFPELWMVFYEVPGHSVPA